MDYNEKIQLGEKKNIDSVNVDNYLKFEFNRNTNIMTEYDLTRFIDETRLYEKERNENNKYCFYGTIEFLSLLDGIDLDVEHLSISDIFIKKEMEIENSLNLLDVFDFYLVTPNDEYFTLVQPGTDTDEYLQRYKVIATPDMFNIMNAGYSTNIFNDKKYYFDVNVVFDNDQNFVDGAGFPITEVYLFIMYRGINELSNELVTFYHWDPDESEQELNIEEVWDVGEVLFDSSAEKDIGTLIRHNNLEYNWWTHKKQMFKIKHGTEEGNIEWKYKPFIPIKLKYYSDNLISVNEDTTSYDKKESIPDYAHKLDNGNYIWREIIPDGEIDPVTGTGVDFPFVNNKKYVFTNFVIPIQPNLDHQITQELFSNIKFGESEIITKRPNNEEINNIGKPC